MISAVYAEIGKGDEMRRRCDNAFDGFLVFSPGVVADPAILGGDPTRVRVPMRGTGAEPPVVVMKVL